MGVNRKKARLKKKMKNLSDYRISLIIAFVYILYDERHRVKLRRKRVEKTEEGGN